MIAEVRELFDQALTNKFGTKKEILNYFLKHPRKELCITNLCEQIKECERRTYSFTFDSNLYRQTIKDVALMFASQALRKAEEDHLSSLERTRREEQNRRIERAKEEIQEFEGGIFKDIIEPEPNREAEQVPPRILPTAN